MNRLSVGVDLVEAVGEQSRTVEARVECAQMVDVVVLYLNLAQHLVPTVAALLLNAVEVAVAQFFEVEKCLFRADER